MCLQVAYFKKVFHSGSNLLKKCAKSVFWVLSTYAQDRYLAHFLGVFSQIVKVSKIEPPLIFSYTVALISPLFFDLARQIITIDTNDGKWGWLHFPNDTNAIKKMSYFHLHRILKKVNHGCSTCIQNQLKMNQISGFFRRVNFLPQT